MIAKKSGDWRLRWHNFSSKLIVPQRQLGPKSMEQHSEPTPVNDFNVSLKTEAIQYLSQRNLDRDKNLISRNNNIYPWTLAKPIFYKNLGSEHMGKLLRK